MKKVVDHFAGKKVQLFEMITQKWKSLKELVLVLEIAYNATIALQSPCITLSDVFGIWTKIRIHLEACAAKSSFKTKLSQNLIECLQARYHTVFDNAQMKCSLLLDPRFRNVILKDRESFDIAKSTLVNLYHRLNGLHEPSPINQASNASSDLHLSFDEQSELNKLMSTSHSNTDRQLDIEEAIILFQPDILPSEKSVLDFWETQKQSILYDLAMAVHSIPPTQVQIERDFSSLGYIFSERRYRLSQQRLEQVLLIHFNKDLFFIVKQEQLSNI